MDGFVSTAKKIYNIKTESNSSTTTDETEEETNYPLSNYYYIFNGNVPRANGKNTDGSTKYENTLVNYSKRRAEVDENGKLKYTYVQPSSVDDIIRDDKEIVLGNAYVGYLNDYTTVNLDEVIKVFFNKYKQKLTENEEAKNVDNLLNKAKSLFADNLMDYEYYLRDANNKPYNKVTDDLIKRYF